MKKILCQNRLHRLVQTNIQLEFELLAGKMNANIPRLTFKTIVASPARLSISYFRVAVSFEYKKITVKYLHRTIYLR